MKAAIHSRSRVIRLGLLAALVALLPMLPCAALAFVWFADYWNLLGFRLQRD